MYVVICSSLIQIDSNYFINYSLSILWYCASFSFKKS